MFTVSLYIFKYFIVSLTVQHCIHMLSLFYSTWKKMQQIDLLRHNPFYSQSPIFAGCITTAAVYVWLTPEQWVDSVTGQQWGNVNVAIRPNTIRIVSHSFIPLAKIHPNYYSVLFCYVNDAFAGSKWKLYRLQSS